MTTPPAASGELNYLDQLGAKAFDGFLVRKDLVRKYSRQYTFATTSAMTLEANNNIDSQSHAAIVQWA
ncbi:MAG: hypothetical protein EBZ76_10730 [Synechococcaceae bacterium WB9_2_170]|nr:hypothetical protein [Synechococcaceae bacterium WB9_2_170]